MSKQYPLPLPHREMMTADDFMVTPSNREAVAWLEKWPDWPAHCLVIYGPSGSGKTHLARVWQARSKAQAAEAGMLPAHSSGHVVIDNADKIAGDAKGEETLFHLYNNLREARGFLLLTGGKSPAQWNIGLPDLRSRLLAAPAVAIAAPDDALLSALIIKQFRDRQIDIGMDVVDYLLPRITRSPAAIRALVQTLDQTSLAEGRGITVALARKLIEDQNFPNSG